MLRSYLDFDLNDLGKGEGQGRGRKEKRRGKEGYQGFFNTAWVFDDMKELLIF